MIRTVQVGKAVYDKLLYPAIAAATNATTIALRIQNRILDKLEHCGNPTTVKEEILCDRCQQIPINDADIAERPPPLYELNGLGAEFKFEEQEAEYILEKINENLPRVQGRLARSLLPLIDALEKTEELSELGLAESAKVQTKEGPS